MKLNLYCFGRVCTNENLSYLRMTEPEAADVPSAKDGTTVKGAQPVCARADLLGDPVRAFPCSGELTVLVSLRECISATKDQVSNVKSSWPHRAVVLLRKAKLVGGRAKERVSALKGGGLMFHGEWRC